MNAIIRFIFEHTPLAIFDEKKTYIGVGILGVVHLGCYLADAALVIPQLSAPAIAVAQALHYIQPVADYLGVGFTCAGGLHAKAKAKNK